MIQTARCIQKAADSDQRHKIESFRIGGTEFAVIVMDLQIQPQELECLIENEVKKGNGKQVLYFFTIRIWLSEK